MSGPSLTCNGYSILFNKTSIFSKRNDKIICDGSLVDNLYLLNPISPMQINSNESNLKIKTPPLVNQTQL